MRSSCTFGLYSKTGIVQKSQPAKSLSPRTDVMLRHSLSETRSRGSSRNSSVCCERRLCVPVKVTVMITTINRRILFIAHSTLNWFLLPKGWIPTTSSIFFSPANTLQLHPRTRNHCKHSTAYRSSVRAPLPYRHSW